MTMRLLVGGPSNSGKSSLLLSSEAFLKKVRSGRASVRCIELDVWSRSYPAFRGEITFEDRPKQFGLEWDWKTPLNARLREFKAATEDLVLGDMPGKDTDEAAEYMVAQASADGAVVVSATLEGIAQWSRFFREQGLDVALAVLTYQGDKPSKLVGNLKRAVDPDHPEIGGFVEALLDLQESEE